jgi:hypothetical protein
MRKIIRMEKRGRRFFKRKALIKLRKNTNTTLVPRSK